MALTAGVDAVAVYVAWSPSEVTRGGSAAGLVPEPYHRHELHFLPARRAPDAPLEFTARVEGGALRIEMSA